MKGKKSFSDCQKTWADKFVVWNAFPGHCLLKFNDSCSAVFEQSMNLQIKNNFNTSEENVTNHSRWKRDETLVIFN